jgi:PAS domain S-box-containing protein
LTSARYLQVYLTRFLSLSYVRQLVRQYFISVGLTALLYFGVAKLIFSGLALGVEPSPVWPPAGISLFMLLSQGRQVWPGVALGVLLIGHWLGVSWLSASGSALGATLEALIGVTLLRRAGFQNLIERLPDALTFIGLAAIAAPLLNATIGTGFSWLTGSLNWSEVGQGWWTYWLGDSMGILVLTPLLLAGQRQLGRLRSGKLSTTLLAPIQSPLRFKLPEKLACFSLLTTLSLAIFHSRPDPILTNYPLEYLPFPFVIWAALRFGQTTALFASFLLSMIAVTGTVAGKGPFALVVGMPQQVLLLQQTFLSVITITALILATMASERRRVELLLRQNQASLAKAQQLARLGNWDFDFKQQQWRWSDELYRLLGLAVQSVMPNRQVFLDAVHPDDRWQVEQAIQAALSLRIPYRINYRLRRADGSERVVEDQVAIGITHATGTLLDITEYKQTEEKLRLNAERNRLLSEMALRIRQSLDLDAILNTTVEEVRQFLQADRVFICRFNSEGQGRVSAESVLPDWPSVMGCTSEAETYPEIQSLYVDSHICVVNDTAQQELTPFIRQYHELYQVQAGICIALLSADSRPLKSAQNSPQQPPQLFGLLVCHQCGHPRQWQPLEIDLLDQLGIQVSIAIQQGQLYQQVQHFNNSLEQQVIERTEQLEVNLAKLGEMNQLQDVFLHAIAHDLRTTVMGTLMVLKNFQQQTGDQIAIPRSTLERMTQSGEIQLCKLNSLLEAYTNKTEGITLHPKALEVKPIIDKVVTQLQPLIRQNRATLNLELTDLPLIEADPEKLESVFAHLLVNAVKHNPPGVEIRVCSEVSPNWISFTVADSGQGIDLAQRERLFELRTGDGQHRQLTGISVGLCLCQQIVSAHGGKIELESASAGSKFRFMLPIRSG